MYRLTAGDRLLVERVAAARAAANRAAGTFDARKGWRHTGEAVERQGFAGEVAFCRLARVRPDESVLPRSKARGEDRAGDATLRDGRTVDVKTPMYASPGARLLAPRNTRLESAPDLYALMQGDWESGEYRLRGVMDAAELLREERLTRLGANLPLTYAASQAELVPTDEFMLQLRQCSYEMLEGGERADGAEDLDAVAAEAGVGGAGVVDGAEHGEVGGADVA